MHKLVSIVIPTYNGKKFIRKTIESCLRQTYKNIELIIIDDSSTDGTSEIIKEYASKDSRVIYSRNYKNLKLPASLNNGFRLAKGEYHSWISDDNYYSDTAIETLVTNLQMHKDADLVYSSYSIINESDSIIDKYGVPPESLLFTCAVGACFLYRKQIFEDLHGYNENKFRMEDYDFWLRACKNFKFRYINFPDIYFYRKHPNNLTTGIYSKPDILNRYKQDYFQTLLHFFINDIKTDFTNEDVENHVQIFFNSMVQEREFTVDSYKQLKNLLQHFDKLQAIQWEHTLFDADQMRKTINIKQKEVLAALAGTLLFENIQLKNKNPKVASYLGNPIFWYYTEYETLPLWYKRLGHIIKTIQNNRPFPLFKVKKTSN